jgi:hypothetical protein
MEIILKEVVVLQDKSSPTRKVWGYVRDLKKQEVPKEIKALVFWCGVTRGGLQFREMSASTANGNRVEKQANGYGNLLFGASSQISVVAEMVNSQRIALRLHTAIQKATHEQTDEGFAIMQEINLIQMEHQDFLHRDQQIQADQVVGEWLQQIPKSLDWAW